MEIGFTNEVYHELREMGPVATEAVYSTLQSTAGGADRTQGDVQLIKARKELGDFRYLYNKERSVGVVVNVGHRACLALGVSHVATPSQDYLNKALERYEVLSCTNYLDANVDYINAGLSAKKFLEVFLLERMPHLFNSDWLLSHRRSHHLLSGTPWPWDARTSAISAFDHYRHAKDSRESNVVRWIERHASKSWMSTEARKNFAKLLNTADLEPQLIERNGHWLVVMSLEQLKNAAEPLSAGEIRRNARSALSGAAPLVYRSVADETADSFNPLG